MISPRRILKQGFVSLCVSAGVLAIANVDAIWREEAHRGDYKEIRRAAKTRLTEKLARPRAGAPKNPVAADLTESLANVELGDVNPFAKLSTLAPLDHVVAKGIASFKRQAYRSPHYKEETGYDLISYQITHPDQTTSVILAYLERTLEGPDAVPVVLIVSYGPVHADQALFRAGGLREHQAVALSVAQGMVAQRLNAGVPFLSVAR